MSGHAIYLRVKRRNQTYCFLCEDTDTILDIKRKVLQAAAQHHDEDEKGTSGVVDPPSSAESLQLLLPAGSEQQPQDDHDDDDDEEMGGDNDGNKRSSFLNDNDTLGSVRGTAMAPGKEESELVLHVVFPVADNEWETVDVEPTVIQDP